MAHESLRCVKTNKQTNPNTMLDLKGAGKGTEQEMAGGRVCLLSVYLAPSGAMKGSGSNRIERVGSCPFQAISISFLELSQ